MSQTVVIKGNRYGICVYLDPKADFETLLKEVAAKFRESAKFFKNARMALSFEGKHLDNEQQREVADVIAQNSQVEILCILSRDEKEEKRYQAAIEQKLRQEKANVGHFYKGTLRSGQVLESEGSVVILGDVNPGAKVMAVGNIIVLGALKGTACAGLTGSRSNFIAALEMEPMQLRIADAIGRGNDEVERKNRRKTPPRPMIAFCGEEGIYVEELSRDVLHDISLG
ncbi:MAG: septum site-determining protein MinC [Lachnospiraceae bacterium]|nr:septum site-determining protein MinC [Lachnospiraceae bacterium]